MEKVHGFKRFAESMRQWRTAKRLTQEAAAEAIGVSRTTVQKWESASIVPNKANIPRILKVYGIKSRDFSQAFARAFPETQSEPVQRGSAVDRLAAVTFFSLNPHGFNPLRVNVCAPPPWRSASAWMDSVVRAFGEAYSFVEKETLALQRVANIVMLIGGVTEIDGNGFVREASRAREKCEKITLWKFHAVTSALQAAAMPNVSKVDDPLWGWFAKGWRALGNRQEIEPEDSGQKNNKRDDKKGWQQRQTSRLSHAQQVIQQEFIEAGRSVFDSLALVLHPYHFGFEKEMFCKENGAKPEDFIGGTAKLILDGDLDAPRSRFFLKLVGNGEGSRRQIPATAAEEDQQALLKEAKEEVFAMAAEVERTKREKNEEAERIKERAAKAEMIAPMAVGALLAIDKKSNKGKNFKGISTVDSALSLPFAELKNRCEALVNIKLVGGSESKDLDEEKLPAFGREGDVKGFDDIWDENPSKGFDSEGSIGAKEFAHAEQDSTSIFAAAYADYKLRHNDCADLNDLDIKARARKSVNEAFFFACVEDVLKDFDKIKEASDEDKQRIARCKTVSTAVIHAIGAERKGTYKEISEAVNDTGANETYLRKLVGVTGPLQKGGFLCSFMAESTAAAARPGTRYELTQDGIILFDALFGVKGEQIRL